MNLIEALEKEKYEHYREKFADWEAKEIIIDDVRAFWEIKEPGSKYAKVSLYRDDETMMIYGDYGRYTFNNMTWLGSPQNLRYDALDYQMEKLDFTTKDAICNFDEELCEKEIREWLAKQLEKDLKLSPADAKEMAAMNDWIMAEEHYEEFFDEADIFCNFSFFTENKTDFDSVCEAGQKTFGIRIDSSITGSYADITVYSDEVYGPLAFAQEAITACRRGESHFLSCCDETDWIYGDEFKKDKTGYKIDDRFYVALVALEVLGDKLRELEAEKEIESLERD